MTRLPPMQRYYAERAREYDQIYEKPERQSDLRLIEQWLSGVLAGHSVFEVACGTGYWTRFFAPLCAGVVAIDSSAETIEIAKSRVPPQKVQFLIGDAYDLPARSEQMSAGFAGFWWSHIPRARITEFLHGFHARLQPGAKVVFLDNRFVEGSSTPVAERDADGNTYQIRRLADGSVHRVLKNFPTPEEIAKTLHGLATEIRHHQWDYYWALEYRLPSA